MAGNAIVFGLPLRIHSNDRQSTQEELTASPGRSITLAYGVGLSQEPPDDGHAHNSGHASAATSGRSDGPSQLWLRPSNHRLPVRGASLSTDRMMRTSGAKPAEPSALGGAEQQPSCSRLQQAQVAPSPPSPPELHHRHPPVRGASLSAVSRMARHPASAGPRLATHVNARQAFGLQSMRTSCANSGPGLAPTSQELQWTTSGCSDESDIRVLARPPSSQSRYSPMVTGDSRGRVSMEEGNGLHRVMKQMVLSDDAAFKRVQASLRGITSLAKETDKLEMVRDASGATCLNQYVVIKTLGKGSFGKVRLCLNTLDGRLRAIKMVDRAFVRRQLQRTPRGLRRRHPRITGNGASTTSQASFSSGQVLPVSIPFKYSLDESRESSREQLTGNAGSGVSRVSDCAQGDPCNSPLESVMREVVVLKRLDHPNVVKLLEIIDPPTSPYIMLVMEYMDGGPIMETRVQGKFACESLSEETVLSYFRQVCQGLDYLHYNNVAHGDLKPENLLKTTTADGVVVKIGDFGSSRIINDARASSKISCTPAFQPPEALQGNSSAEDPFAADIWSLGVCLYSFVFARLPFTGSCTLDVSKAILEKQVQYPADTVLSPELLDLLMRMMVKDPAGRITLEDIMTHPWTTSNGICPLRSLKSLLSPPEVIQASRMQAADAFDQSPLVSMIRARLKERCYKPGEYLFREYEQAHSVYMIMSGVVEMMASKPVDGPLLVNPDGTSQEELCVDLDDSFTLDCPVVPTASMRDGKLHIDRSAAEDMKKQMSALVMGRGQEYVAEIRGPGQVIGEVSIGTAEEPARHQMSARAKESVTVVELTENSLMVALRQVCGPDADLGDTLMSFESVLLSHCNSIDPFSEKPLSPTQQGLADTDVVGTL